ncbi:MAG TPA: NADH-quinone oxidoreductase subunit M [Acidimicrobiales bacterium]|nr:NADH-quinone oxidoreductase subunit M [Acidimicrobiales bacterium]
MKTAAIPILNIIVFLPLAGAIVSMLIPAAQESRLARPIGLLFAVVEFGFVMYLCVDFPVGQAGFQFVSSHSWIGAFGISWALGVDGISLFLVAVTALLFPVAMFGPSLRTNAREFMAWMLLLEAACMGTFLSLDLFVFFVMFEVTLVPGYFLVARWGGLRRNYAAMKFFIYTFAGSAFLFVAILALVLLVAPRNGGHETFSLITLARYASSLPAADQVLIFCGFAVAFAVKIPLVPFHSWLPDTYTEAPTAGSMILAGILFKLGAYGLLRLGVYVLPRGAADMAPVLLTLAAIGIVYGSLITIMQRDLKRLVAYASIVDVAFIVLGFFAFSSQGVTGGVFEMVNHGLTTGALFFLVGVLWERRGTLRFKDLGGIQKSAPILAAIFLAVVMSAVGLPGLNGFAGEFLVLVGTFITHRWWAVVATSAVVTGVIYMLWAYQRTFHGPVVAGNEAVRDISWREIAAVAPLLAGMVFLGVFPRPFLDRITPSVQVLLGHVAHVAPSAGVPKPGPNAVTYTVPADQNVDRAVRSVSVTRPSSPPGGSGSAAAAAPGPAPEAAAVPAASAASRGVR